VFQLMTLNVLVHWSWSISFQ